MRANYFPGILMIKNLYSFNAIEYQFCANKEFKGYVHFLLIYKVCHFLQIQR